MAKNKKMPKWVGIIIVNAVAIVLIISSVMLGVAGFVISKLTYTEKYVATAIISVDVDGDEADAFEIKKDFAKALCDAKTNEDVLEHMRCTTGYATFDGTIDAQVIRDTTLIKIEVTSLYEHVSYEFIQAILSNYTDVYPMISEEDVSIVEAPDGAKLKSDNTKIIYGVVIPGILIALIILVSIIFNVIEIMSITKQKTKR